MRTLDKIKLWLKVNTYNPFTPHIVYSDKFGGFAIRKYNIYIGWDYLDAKDAKFFWWQEETYMHKYCKILTLELAKKRLSEYNWFLRDNDFVRIPQED